MKKHLSKCCGAKVKTAGIPDFSGGETCTVNHVCLKCNKPCDIKEGAMFKGWTDVCGGKMTLKEVYLEAFHYFYHKNPSRLIIDIQRKKDGIYTKIWMSNKDWKGG